MQQDSQEIATWTVYLNPFRFQSIATTNPMAHKGAAYCTYLVRITVPTTQEPRTRHPTISMATAKL